uniref:Putative terminase n=1 Tax=viral metagenome TaxID=1070528 RepID=A0A6M3KFQ8_9ZZZZ
MNNLLLDKSKPDILTDKEIFEAEKIIAQKDPFFLVENEYLTIKTKAGELQRFKLNSVQRIILNKIKELNKLGKPIRLWILKARQAGVSTLTQAIFYAFTSQREGINSTVISHDLDSSNYLFEMQKLFNEKLDAHLRPQIKHSNEKKLEFDKIHSQILIDTADNKKAGRSFTFRFVHLSEVSRYPALRELLLGINQSVPNLPGTMVIGETTANGMNEFYDEWIRCVDGQSDWETLFVPWFQVEEYTMILQDGNMYPVESIEFITPSEKEKFLIEEGQIKIRYGLTTEQLNWRRWCIVNNCNRSLGQFHQEFPINWEEAFLSTGNLFFDREALKLQIIRKPFVVGNIVKEEGVYKFREDPVGLFKIYELPKQGEQYVIGADAAEGLEHGDKSAGIVVNKRNNKTSCVYNHNIPPERFAEDLIKMGNYYSEAMIACENKGYGYSVNQDIYKRYGKVYRRTRTKKGFNEPTMELGWNTNGTTRPQMLAQLAEEILEGSTDLLDKDLIHQCWTFINNVKRGQPEAEKGKCDDLVMARAIVSQIRIEHPYKQRITVNRKKRFRGLSGY